MEAVCATGTPTVVVLCAGSAVELCWADEHAGAILDAWYPGAQGGLAIAEVLFGLYNPAGRLPVTFYRSTEELPDFTDYAMKNRTYRYMERQALYPFGFGLSYTRFSYSELALSKTQLSAGETLTLEVTVTNTGALAGDEVAECYIRDEESNLSRPRWSLCAFTRLHLEAGESRRISLEIRPEAMALVQEDGSRVIEPGAFTLFVGGSQPDSRSKALLGQSPLEGTFTIQ